MLSGGIPQTLIQQAREQVVKLLTTDWLITDAERTEGEADACMYRLKAKYDPR
jgi:hypothetical protein